MKTNYILTGLLFFYLIPFQAQVVETLVTHTKIRDGMFVDTDGNIYTTSGGWQNSLEIGKYDIEAETFTYNYFTGVNGPIDIDERANGDYVVTNFNDNTVVTIDISTNQITQIASGLDGPAGIAIDDEDNIYISNFGAGPLYEGHQIHKITPEGVLSILADSPLLYRFQAIVFNGDGELIVSSQFKLYKVDTITGELTEWVDLETFGFGHMIYRSLDNSIYGTATGEHKIFRVDAEGMVTVFAGSVAGLDDGDLETALFNAPLGIEISPDENIIYVGDTNKLRRIIIDVNLGVDETSLNTFKVSPNPTNTGLVTIYNNQGNALSLALYDVSGKLLFTKNMNQLQQTLDLTAYTNGMYFLNIKDGENTVCKKIIKNN